MSDKKSEKNLSPDEKRRRKDLRRLFLWIGISVLLVAIGTSVVYHLYWGIPWHPFSFLSGSGGTLPQ